MSIQEVGYEAEQRARGVKQCISQVAQALNGAIEQKEEKPCTVCGAHAEVTQPYSVIPTSFVATCIVLNDLDTHSASLSLRCAWLCADHFTHFRNLFVDAGRRDVDLERLERRVKTLQAVVYGQLVVFGGAPALKVVDEFHADIARIKAELSA